MSTMVFKHFVGIKDEVELKSKFKELAKVLHPDRGGNHEVFVVMMQEYNYCLENKFYPIVNNNDYNRSPFTVYGTGDNYSKRGTRGGNPFNSYNGKEFDFNMFDEFLKNFSGNFKAEQKAEQSLDPKEIQRRKAEAYFNIQRIADKVYDIIDNLLKEQSNSELKLIITYKELCKLDNLQLDHFKYLTFKVGKSSSIGVNLYQNYLKGTV